MKAIKKTPEVSEALNGKSPLEISNCCHRKIALFTETIQLFSTNRKLISETLPIPISHLAVILSHRLSECPHQITNWQRPSN